MNVSKRQLVRESVAHGAGMVRQRIGLVILLYVVEIGVALLLAIPIYNAFVEHVGSTGFGADLIEGFDLLLWREILDAMSGVLSGVGLQLLWIVPLYWLWKTAAHMGVIYALHQGALWPFWRGVGYYTGRGLLVSFIFLPMKVLVLVIAIFFSGFLANAIGGEIAAFWSTAVLMPFLLIGGLSLLELFQRYARIAIVVRHDTVWNAVSTGFAWPFKYGAASYLYLIWYAVALVVGLATFGLNAVLHVGVSAIVFGFLIQQISRFTRAAVTVGWIGSEVELFERTHINELPLIADAEEINMPDGGVADDPYVG